ncbi:integral membrane [Fusarium longipes]|uniref:Integral membrane n=1 Tax=Fusarium longipes TaxID=694270 RepID=A0A395S2H1_9HYPO|nr:integral membrane [Fusarium longipes]
MPAPPPFVVNTDPERVAESQTALIIGVIAAVNFVALSVVAARTYTRLVISKSPGTQDVLMVLSACTGLVGTIILILQIPHGLGKHADTIERADFTIFSKYSFIITVVPLLGGIGLLKISIALELIKYNGNSWQWYRISLWCMIGFVIAYTIEAWLSFILFCNPVSRQWDLSIEGSCYPVSTFIAFGLANSAFNIFTDIAFATLPIPLVWSLKMPLKTRIYLVVVLSLGYVAAVMGVVKAVSQMKYDPAGDNTFLYDIQFWGLLQLNVGTIAACAPSLRPLVKNILRLRSVTPAYGYGYSDYGQRQDSLPLSTIGGTGASSTVRRGDQTGNTKHRHNLKNAIYVDTVFELKNSSQTAILDSESTERTKVQGSST